MPNKVTAKLLKRAVRLLRKHKVEPPYYVEVENPKEGGDPLYKKITNKRGK